MRSKPPIVCICLFCGGVFNLPQWRINAGMGIYCSQVCYREAVAKQPIDPWTPDRPEIWDQGVMEPKGHFLVYRPDYPNSSSLTGRAKRYHIVWWLRTGEVIKHPWVLHHKNENKLDDRFDNLEKMLGGDHTRLHSSKPLIACICVVCNETFYLPQWRINQGRGKLCSQRCYQARGKSAVTRTKMTESQIRAWAEGRRHSNS